MLKKENVFVRVKKKHRRKKQEGRERIRGCAFPQFLSSKMEYALLTDIVPLLQVPSAPTVLLLACPELVIYFSSMSTPTLRQSKSASTCGLLLASLPTFQPSDAQFSPRSKWLEEEKGELASRGDVVPPLRPTSSTPLVLRWVVGRDTTVQVGWSSDHHVVSLQQLPSLIKLWTVLFTGAYQRYANRLDRWMELELVVPAMPMQEATATVEAILSLLHSPTIPPGVADDESERGEGGAAPRLPPPIVPTALLCYRRILLSGILASGSRSLARPLPVDPLFAAHLAHVTVVDQIKGVSLLSRLTSLRVQNVDQCRAPLLTELKLCQTLQRVDVHGTVIGDVDLVTLAQLPRLRVLDVSNCDNITSFGPLSKSLSLERLQALHCAQVVSFGELLTSSPSLTTLRLDGFPSHRQLMLQGALNTLLSARSIAMASDLLRSPKLLRRLSLDSVVFPLQMVWEARTLLQSSAARQLQQQWVLKHLTELHLPHMKWHTSNTTWIAALPSLVKLSLSGSTISSEEDLLLLSQSAAPSLAVLDLSGCASLVVRTLAFCSSHCLLLSSTSTSVKEVRKLDEDPEVAAGGRRPEPEPLRREWRLVDLRGVPRRTLEHDMIPSCVVWN
jgi:hypothetical protein